MKRRTLLKAGTTLGALAVAGVCGAYRLLPPRRSRVLSSADDLARRLYAGLEPELREQVCVGYDHPLRQYHNRGVWGGGASIFSAGFSRAQRGILTDLLHAGLSEQGRERVPNEFFASIPGVHSMKVLICGDPFAPPYQLILTGPHLNLRIGGASREGAAFGGPQVYGDQRGDERAGLPGNMYRYQLECGQRLFRSLDPGQRREALLATAPIQTQIEPQGRAGVFPGIPVAELTSASQDIARELVDGIFSTYPPEDVRYAGECLERNGGLGALHLSYYADGEVERSGQYQIFRLEGPAAVLHFRGAPHVHAFVNVTMDGDAPFSVGEALGENPAVLEGAGVKTLFERAMQAQAGTDLAYYDFAAVVGRLRKGTIRTGDVYTLESWQGEYVVVEVRGSRLAPALAEALRASGKELEPERKYTIAMAGVENEQVPRRLGWVEASRPGTLVRDAAIAYLREHGFAGLQPDRG